MSEAQRPKNLLSTASAKEAAVEAAALERARRQRAAREQAALTEPEAIPTVKARITHKGHGLVSMGKHVGGIGEVYFEKGEIVPDMPQPSAEELQERGFVEIID
jgi:hypothetical protein